MTEAAVSIVPIFAELRAAMRGDDGDFDRRLAVTDAWMERLKHHPDFAARIGAGGDILMNAAVDGIERRLNAIEARLVDPKTTGRPRRSSE